MKMFFTRLFMIFVILFSVACSCTEAAGTSVFQENFNWTSNPAKGGLASQGYVIYGWDGATEGTLWNEWTYRTTTGGALSTVGYYSLPKQGSGSAFTQNLSSTLSLGGVAALQVYKNGDSSGLGTASISHEVTGLDPNYYHTAELWYSARGNQTACLGVSIGEKTFEPITYKGAASEEAGKTFSKVFVPTASAQKLTVSNIRETGTYADSALLVDNINVTNTRIPVIDAAYTPVYAFNLATPSTVNLHTNLTYDYDFTKNLAGIEYDRVMYRVELTDKNGVVSTLTLSMDDFSNGNIKTLGIPVSSTPAKYIGTPITNLNVAYSTTGTPTVSAQSQASTSGTLQFFSSNYNQTAAVPAEGTGNGYGSMRVFDADGNSLFAYSGWGYNTYVNSVGIGVNPNVTDKIWSDWTFRENVGDYTSANLYVYVHEYEKILDPHSVQIFQRDRATETGSATISGSFLPAPSTGTVTAVQLSEDGQNWVNTTLSGANYSTDMNLSTGWHSFQVRALDAEGNTLFTSEQKVGIGDIFITSGQSNAGSFSQKMTSSTSGNVFALDVTTGEWTLSADPQPNNSGFGTWNDANTAKGSVWPSFGDKLTEFTEGGIPIGLVATAYGGASVSAWDPNTGSLYHVLKDAMKAVGNDFTAILWHQGETDNVNNMSEEEYETHLLALIDRSREDAGENVLWFISEASLFTDGDVDENITKAQRDVTQLREGVFAGPNSDLLGLEYRISASNIHFNEQGQILLGQMWAVSVNDALYHVPEPSSAVIFGLGIAGMFFARKRLVKSLRNVCVAGKC